VPPPVSIPRAAGHKIVGWAAAVSAFLAVVVLEPLGIAFVVAPASPSSGAGISVLLLVGAFMMIIATLVTGVGWLSLEMKHRTAVRKANAERNKNLLEIRREKARREAAYKAAVRRANAEWEARVQKANAERDAILAEIRRDEACREAAYEAAVRKANAEWEARVQKANAERDAILSKMRREMNVRRQAYQDALAALLEAESEWRKTASGYKERYDELKRSLDGLKYDFLNLKPRYEKENLQLEQDTKATQFVQFLQTQFISDHEIPGIGPTREAVLRSNGIETAYDIEQDLIREIPGFGPVLTNALLDWKEQVSRLFRFNATAGVSPTERALLVMKYKQFQQRMEAKLQSGLVELRECSHKSGHQLSQLYDRIPGLVVRLEQAKIDLQVVSEWESEGL
jgi:hypothetical protein